MCLEVNVGFEVKNKHMKQCKMCKSKIVGRTDKKFCNVKCKNIYHTKLRIANNKEVIQIDKILHRNRAILLEIMGKKRLKIEIERVLLDNKNFNYNYHTHTYVNNQNKTYYYIYDFAWMEFSNSQILLIRKKKQAILI